MKLFPVFNELIKRFKKEIDNQNEFRLKRKSNKYVENW